MTRIEQMNFVDTLCETIKDKIIRDISKVPEDWDGFELRHWVADRFKEDAIFGGPDKKRLKEYKNTALVNNLL